MKSLSVITFLVIGLSILGYEAVGAMDYRRFGETDEGMFFYDIESISHPSKDIVRVWIKETFTGPGVRVTSRALGKNYEDLDHSISQEELNCKDKVFRQLSLTLYGKGEESLYSSTNLVDEFHPIRPDSINDDLYKAVCEQKEGR
jgi:hypothetical protein